MDLACGCLPPPKVIVSGFFFFLFYGQFVPMHGVVKNTRLLNGFSVIVLMEMQLLQSQ